MLLSIKQIILLALAVILLSIGGAAFYKIFFTTHVIKVGYIFTGSVEEDSWDRMHYNAVNNACKNLGLQLVYRDKVLDTYESAGKAAQSLIDEGALAVMYNNNDLIKYVLPVIKKNPTILFLQASRKNHSSQIIPYFVRMYQAEYLAGLVAGMKTRTNNVGIVVGFNGAEVNRGISAFAIGLRTVNKYATVYVKFCNDWKDYDKLKHDSVKLIKGHEIDVITSYLYENKAVKDAANAMRVYSIGFSNRRDVNDPSEITAVVADWRKAYTIILRRVYRYFTGAIEEIPVSWLGVNEGVVGLDGLSSEVDPAYKIMIESATRDLVEGRDVFDGTLYDNHDELKYDQNDPITDDDLMDKFNWLVEGVEVVK